MLNRVAIHFLLFSFVLIPAGGFAALKATALVVYLLLNFKRILGRYYAVHLYFALTGLIIISAYIVLGLNNKYVLEHSIQLSSILVISYSILSVQHSLGAIEANNNYFLFLNYLVLYAVFKISLFCAFLFGIIEYQHIHSLIGNIGFVFQDYAFWGFPGVVRMTTSNDFLLATVLLLGFFFSARYKISTYYTVLICIALVLSFSRIFILIVSTIFLTRFFINRKFLVIKLTSLLSIALYIDWSIVNDLITFRFGDTTSGDTKVEQSLLMMPHIYNTFFMGNGIGFYLDSYIRSNTEPFTYENHIFQLIMQIGFIGLIWVLFPYTYYFKNLLRSNKIRLVMFITFFLFLNTTNPYINSLTSPFIIFAIYRVGYVYSRKLSRPALTGAGINH